MRGCFSNIFTFFIAFLLTVNGWAQCEFEDFGVQTTEVCTGTSDLELVLAGAPEEYTFQWAIFIDGEWNDVENGIPEGAEYDQLANSLSVSGLNAIAQLLYHATIISEDYCNDVSVEFEILIIEEPSIDFSCIEDQYCSGESVSCDLAGLLDGWVISEIDFSLIPGIDTTGTQSSVDSFEFEIINETFESESIQLSLTLNKNGCESIISTNFIVNPLPQITVVAPESACSNTVIEIEIESNLLEEVQVEATFLYVGIQHSLEDNLTSSISVGEALILEDSTFEATSGISVLNLSVLPSFNNCAGSTQEISIVFGQVSGQIQLSTDSICSGSTLEVELLGEETSEFVLSTVLEDVESQYEYNDPSFSLLSQQLLVQTIELILVESIFFGELLVCEAVSDHSDVIGILTPEILPVIFDEQICSSSILSISSSPFQFGTINYSRVTTNGDITFGASEIGELPYMDLPVNVTSSIVEVTFDLEANNLGCNSNETITVELIPQDLTLVPDTLTMCNNELFEVEFNPDLDSASVTYERIIAALSYSSSTFPVGGVGISDQLTNLTDETVLVNYIVTTTLEGCTTDLDTFTVSLLPSLAIDIINLEAIQCEGDTVLVDFQTSSGDATILWSRELNENFEPQFASGFGAIEEMVMNVTETAQFLEYLVVLQQNQCTSDTLNVIVELINGPNLIVSENSSICPGESTQLFAAGAIFYEWFPSDNMNFPFVQDPVVTLDESTNYTVIGTGLNGCSNRSDINIEILNIPQILSLNESYDVCEGGLIELELENASLIEDLVFSEGSVSIIEGIIQIIPDQNGEFNLQIQSVDGCIIDYSSNVTVLDTPSAFISGPEEVCQGSVYTLFNVPLSNSEFNWDVQNGEIMTGGDGSAIWVEWNESSENGIVTIEITADNGCIASSSFDVIITEEIAPILEPVFQIATGLLAVSDNYEVYTWGKEDISSLESEYTCGGISYCLFENIDPTNFNYFVEYGLSQGCINRSYYLSPTVGIDNYAHGQGLAVYPNPSVSDYVTIQSTTPMKSYNLLEVSGREIDRGILPSVMETKIDLNGISGSIMILIVHFTNGESTMRELIISN